MKYLTCLEMVMVLMCLGSSMFCFGRISLLIIQNGLLAMKFGNRLAIVDSTSFKSVFPFFGKTSPWRMKKYIAEKGQEIDPELLDLYKKINSPVKYGLLTVLMIPGGVIFAGAIMLIFDAYLKNLNR